MAQLIAEPLDGGTGHENRAFERVGRTCRQADGNGGDKTVLLFTGLCPRCS